MQYYLQTIQEYLTVQGYSNVFYDYDNPSEEERIYLQPTGGAPKEVAVPNLYQDFAIYIRRNSRALARSDTQAIFALLDSFQFPDKGILKLETITPPTIYTIEPTTGSQSEFIIQFRCLVLDSSLNRLY
jgi:hypothetical protein